MSLPKMKIAHVITGLGVGGAERVVLELSDELVHQGHQVAIWVLTADLGALERGVDKRVAIHALNLSRNPLTWGAAWLTFLRGMRDYQPQVLHAHMFHAVMLALLAKLTLRASLRVVFTSHTQSINGWWRRVSLRLSRYWRDADVVFSHGQHPQLNASSVVVIPNGIARVATVSRQERGAAMDRPWRFINVARFTQPKAHLVLLREFAKVTATDIDAELWLVGDGPLRKDVVQAVRNLDLDDRVRLLGSRTDVMELLAAADIFVMSSKWEGLPIALLEAGLAELPVISTPVGSVPEVLAHGCGVLAAPQELAVAMTAAVMNWRETREMGRRLRKRVQSTYSMDAMAQGHLNLYAKVCGSAE